MSKGLILHAGAKQADYDAVCEVVTPAATDTWCPVPHDLLIRQVTQTLSSTGISVVEQSFGLSKDGMKMFGVMTLGGGSDYAATLGIRNSHDKTFPIGLALGARVFVCDNLSFSSEVVIKTKHTRHVLNRMSSLVSTGVAKLIDRRRSQDERIALYKETEVRGLPHLHDLVLRTYRSKAIPAAAIPLILDEVENPHHPEFKEPTLWSYFNCVTEVLKGFADVQSRTQRLHGVVDADCPSLLAVSV